MNNDLILLQYSEKQRMFHFADIHEHNMCYTTWINLSVLSLIDAISFVKFIDSKYVDKRKTGIIPEYDIIKLEIELFNTLKTSKRKLSGRY